MSLIDLMNTAKKKETKDIWDEEEVEGYSVFQDDEDGRLQPE